MRVYKIVSLSVVILLITVLFAGVVTVPAAAAQAVTANPTTMQYRYNAQHTGDYSSVAGPVPSNGQLKWKYTTGDWVWPPAVAIGIVYVGSADLNAARNIAHDGSANMSRLPVNQPNVACL